LRQYYQALQDAANGPLVSTRYSPILDAKYAAYRAAGATVDAVDGIKSYMASRRTYILSLLNNVNASFAVTSGTNYSVTNNLVTLAGTAPVGVRSILFNGIAREVTWTTMTNWTMNLALTNTTNSIVIAGKDKNGVQLGSVTVNVTDTAQLDAPEGSLVFNEIMYNPVTPHASYVELLNTSTTTSFDLSGWKVDGLGFTFPVGTVVAPGAYLLLVENVAAFTSAFGTPKNLAGTFTGNLSVTGETLRLIRPDDLGALTRVVNEVTFSNNPPWPDAANGGGSSLQLIDSKQDNNRVGNWRAVTNNPVPSPQWQHVTATGSASSATLYVYMNSPGDVYIDDLKIVSGSVPDVGANFVQNGDFESALTGPWTLSPNVSGSTISTSVKHSGNASLHLVATSAGTTQGSSMWQLTSPALTTGQTYTLSFWYLQNTNGGSLTARLSGSGIALGANILPGNGSQPDRYTPGEANNTASTLAPFPTLRLNEILPNNVTGSTDALGHHHAWAELVNTGTNDINLTGLYLSDSTDALLKWPLPSATIAAGKFALIWLDGNPNESTATEWHANFTVPVDLGSIFLTRVASTNTNIVDFLNYFVSSADTSFGDFPDGDITNQRGFYYPTPAAANDGRPAPVHVVINEWMASNTATIPDPADGQFDDWFELFNNADVSADLSGYFLTDSTASPTQFVIPGGTTIAPHGRLLVWADGQPEQNSATNPDLHVNFQLSKSGEQIAFYSPESILIDLVNFGKQTNDISMGRYPDGTASIYFMTNATPGFANLLGGSLNTAPHLTIPSGLSVWGGQAITFTVTATDDDLPEQSLTFSLDAGAPAGAGINSDTGLFAWRAPIVSQTTNVNISMRVTDNGVPPLSEAKTLQITILPLPTLASAAIETDSISMQWNVIAGHNYQAQYTDDLETPNWISLGT
ncbi:MAG: lamin tail domain-containing protein, partial [Limisphaerales bacterium]